MSFDSYTNSGQGQNLFQQLVVQANRDPVNGVDLNDPGGGPYQIDRKWINLVSKTYWRYQGQGIWIRDSGSTGPMLMLTGDDTVPVVPNSAGVINLNGLVVANGTHATSAVFTESPNANTEKIDIQVSAAIAATDITKVGLAAFNNTEFTVDANGFVALVGGPGAAVTGLIPDAHTNPGTSPVVPLSGDITLEGGVTFATGTQAHPIRTNSLAAHTIDFQIQLAGSNAGSSTANNFGVSQFDSNQFNVTSGFVQLAGGTTAAIEKVNVQTGSFNPIVPSASAITINGATVLAGTNPVRTDGTGASTMAVEVQISQAIASTDATKIGLSNFNSANFVVDANGFVSNFQSNIIGASNLGIAYSGGTFTVQGANGSALSSTNPAYVTVPSVNIPGELVTFKITSNATFKDNASGSSQIAGNTFGVSIASGAYNQDIPFFLYAVLNSAQTSPAIETTLTFMISRMPNVMTTLGSTKISPLSGTAASTQGGFFALAAITASNYANSSALSLGSFRMQSTSGVADWTVQTLNANDGIGRFQENNVFTIPTGAFGAAASSLFYANGGTAPQFSVNNNGYYVDKTNQCQVTTALSNCTVSGVGSVTLQFAAPYGYNGGAIGSGNLTNASGVIYVMNLSTIGSDFNQVQHIASGGVGVGAGSLVLQNSNVSSGSSFLMGHFLRYQILFS